MPLDFITDIFSSIGSIIMVIVGFGLVIFVHEFGHFIFAKKIGAKVERFSLGFGPKLFGFTMGGTDYRVSLIPLGGYVRIKGLGEAVDPGEKPEEKSEEKSERESEGKSEKKTDSHDDFSQKTVGQRFQVFVAGVLMNFLFAFPLCIIVLLMGRMVPDRIVTDVEPGTPAFAAGLKPGDEVLSVVEGRETSADEISDKEWEAGSVRNWQRMNRIMLLGEKENAIFLKVERDGQEMQLRIAPLKDVNDIQQRMALLGLKGGEFEVVVEDVPKESVNYKRLKPGDVIKSVAGVPIRDALLLNDLIFHACKEPSVLGDPASPPTAERVQMLVERDGKPLALLCDTRVKGYYQPGIELYLKPEVGSMRAFSAGVAAGLKKGDHIVSIRYDKGLTAAWDAPGRIYKVERWQNVEDALGDYINERGKRPDDDRLKNILVTVNRGGVESEFEVMPEPARELMQALAKAGRNDSMSFAAEILGIAPKPGLYVWKIMPRSPLLTEFGCTLEPQELIAVGDRVLIIDALDIGSDRSLITPQHVNQILSQGYPVQNTADTEDNKAPNMLIVYKKDDGKEYQVGIGSPLVSYRSWLEFTPAIVMDKDNAILDREDLGGAIVRGLQMPFGFLDLTYKSLVFLISGRAKADQLMGPVGIIQLSYRSAEEGISDLLWFLAFISINLAVLNILPIPVLDGGHVAFLIAEKIRGKPVSDNIRMRFEVVGLIVLVGFILFATWNDVVGRLLGL